MTSIRSSRATREYVPAELLNPPLPGAVGGPGVDTKRRWVHCRVTRRDKTRFEMRTEVGGVFMLSAALDRKRGCFYISSYEQFPEWGPGSAGGTPKFVAVLTRETADGAEQSAASGAFRLRLCGAAAVAAAGGGGGGKALGARASALGVGALGPPLASMSHSVTHLKQAGADMRSLSVSMPEIRFGNAHYLYGQPAPGGAPAPPPPGVGRQLTLRNRLPEWNEQWNCLYLKFNRGRVKESSSRTSSCTTPPCSTARRTSTAAPRARRRHLAVRQGRARYLCARFSRAHLGASGFWDRALRVRVQDLNEIGPALVLCVGFRGRARFATTAWCDRARRPPSGLLGRRAGRRARDVQKARVRPSSR